MSSRVRAGADDPAAAGRRATRQSHARRRRWWRRAALVAAALAAAGMAALLVVRIGSRPPSPAAEPDQDTIEAAPVTGPQDTLLLARTARDDGPAVGVTLLAAGPRDGRGTVLFLPVGTLVDVPGFGLERLGAAYQYGGADLLQASVENVLGVRVDAVASVGDDELAAFLEPVGGLAVDVDEPLVRRGGDGTARVRFERGEQALDAEELAEYWSFRNRGEDELATLPRQQQVLGGLLDAVAADPDLLDDVLGEDRLDTDAEPAWVHDLLRGLAEARAGEELAFTLLPVEPFGSDATAGASYRPRDDAISDLVARHLPGSVPETGGDQVIRLQVLNGVGVPGVGQGVDRRLDGERFRLVRTDNAANFDFTETQILVYDEDPASLAAARRVQERLGVGTIRVSRQSQTVVDLTIVVGSDFLDQEQET